MFKFECEGCRKAISVLPTGRMECQCDSRDYEPNRWDWPAMWAAQNQTEDMEWAQACQILYNAADHDKRKLRNEILVAWREHYLLREAGGDVSVALDLVQASKGKRML